jgi:hypothetical protein
LQRSASLLPCACLSAIPRPRNRVRRFHGRRGKNILALQLNASRL